MDTTLRLPSILVVVCFVVAAACGGDDEQGAADADVVDDDAGRGAVDAAAPPADAGTPDAGTSDAAVLDAAPLDAGLLPVEVQVVYPFEGLAGIDVVFHDASGAVLAHETTDALGRASSVVPPDSMVSVLRPPPAAPTPGQTTRQTVTYVGAQPGDVLQFRSGVMSGSGGGGDVTTAEYTLPGPAAGATQYDIHVGCATPLVTVDPAPAGGLVHDVTAACLGTDDTFAAIAKARDGSGAVVAYTYAKSIAVTPGGTTSVVFPDWSTDHTVATVDLTDPGFTTLGAQLAVGALVDTRTYALGAIGGGGDGMALTFEQVPGFDELVDVNVDTVGFTGVFALARRAAPPIGDVTVDLVGDMLPGINSLTVTATDPARPQIDIDAAGDLSVADGALLVLSWDDVEVGEWLVVFPSTATSVSLPELPAALASYAPTAGGGVVASVRFLEGDFIAGYDALRADALAIFEGEDLPDEPAQVRAISFGQ